MAFAVPIFSEGFSSDLKYILTMLPHKRPSKGQLISEWIYEVIVSPKISTKNFKDFCP
jgi:hypothetical protein